jgi:quercetin dioxygenase-like cupin family protein
MNGERPADHVEPSQPVDLDGPEGHGPLWGLASEDLNATLLCWSGGDGVAEHVNTERDVLVVVIDGSGTLWIDAREHELVRHHAMLVPKGTRRSIRAGPDGLRYLSVHLRRGGLRIEHDLR